MLLEEAAESAPDPLTLAEPLGRAYALGGELESAIAVFERALAAARAQGNEMETLRFDVLLANALIDANGFGRAARATRGRDRGDGRVERSADPGPALVVAIPSAREAERTRHGGPLRPPGAGCARAHGTHDVHGEGASAARPHRAQSRPRGRGARDPRSGLPVDRSQRQPVRTGNVPPRAGACIRTARPQGGGGRDRHGRLDALQRTPVPAMPPAPTRSWRTCSSSSASGPGRSSSTSSRTSSGLPTRACAGTSPDVAPSCSNRKAARTRRSSC